MCEVREPGTLGVRPHCAGIAWRQQHRTEHRVAMRGLQPREVRLNNVGRFRPPSKAKLSRFPKRSGSDRTWFLLFSAWCATHGQSPLPANYDTVALYVADLAATHKPATVTRRISAISQALQIAGMESPTDAAKVRLVMTGIRRTLGTAQEAKTPD